MAEKPKILVYCANGLQGHAIVSQLREAAFPCRAMVRDVARSAHLKRLGAEVVQADLDAPDAMAEAHRDVHAVLMQLPAGDEPENLLRRAEAAIDAIVRAGIRRVIFNAAVRYPRAVADLPSFEARQSVEHLIQSRGLRWTIVRQTFLLQNLLLPYVVQGIVKDGAIVYPVRTDVSLSWVAAEDVGRLAAAIVDHDIFGEGIDLGGEHAVNGDALADCFAEALGRSIRFVPLPLDDFERGVDAALGDGVGRRVGAIFRFIEEHPGDRAFVTTPYVASPRLPDFSPMAVSAWARLHREAYFRRTP